MVGREKLMEYVISDEVVRKGVFAKMTFEQIERKREADGYLGGKMQAASLAHVDAEDGPWCC